eukprot:gene5503-5738_t
MVVQTLYKDGGIARFYQGVGPALLQVGTPLGAQLCLHGAAGGSRQDELDETLPLARVGVKTAAASAAAGAWRMFLLPLDATKTMMQVEGQAGLQHLWLKVRRNGPGVLYHGAAASAAATFAGHYPWFTTAGPAKVEAQRDVVSNSVRVVKTTRQTARSAMSYKEVVQSIVAQDGVSGLFTRGLTTRIAANGLQNICFTVLWQLGQDSWKQSGVNKRLEGHMEQQQ